MHWLRVVGWVVVGYALGSTVGWSLLCRFVLPAADWSEFAGEWAFVSGSSYGIGAQFAESLAKRGMNVILCARTERKLLEIEKNIRELYPTIQTKILVADVLQDGWESVLDSITHLNVSVVVNNVGGGNFDGTLKFYHEFPEEHHQNILKLNLLSLHKTLFKLIPALVARRKGRILNVGSLGSTFGYKLSLYGAAKGFMNTWSEQLNTEYEEMGIRTEALLVGEVSTPAIGNKPPDGLLVATPAQVTESALDLWGSHVVYSPFWGHALMHWGVTTVLPHSVIRFAVRNIMALKIEKDIQLGHQLVQKIRNEQPDQKENL